MKTILILENDPTSLTVLRAVLEREYRIVATETSEDAIAACGGKPIPDVFVSDNQLRATLSGLQTLLQVHQSLPLMPCLIVSGTPPEGWTDCDFECFIKLVAGTAVDFLQKPFTVAALTSKVKALIDGKSDSKAIRTLSERAARYRETTQSWRYRFPQPA